MGLLFAVKAAAAQTCPTHNRRFRQLRASLAWCITCEQCEEGFCENETVRIARISHRYAQATVFLHERCWDQWCSDRVALKPQTKAGLARWAGAP